MHTTPLTLLQKLRSHEDRAAWERFVDLYTPLLLTWARRTGLQQHDAADLVQEVFVVLLHQMPDFVYDPERRNFRGWLRTICLNKWRDWKKRGALKAALANNEAIADVETSDDGLQEFWDREHNTYLVGRALALFERLDGELAPLTVQIGREAIINQRPVREIAAEYKVTENTVYIARMRVLRRLRQMLTELLD